MYFNKENLKKLSDWDLVNSFITAVWWKELKINKRDEKTYRAWVLQTDLFRDEILRRLSR